jgi:hypothetical protein
MRMTRDLTPGDWPIGRPWVATAAVLAILLFASAARAGLIQFNIDQNHSNFGFVLRMTRFNEAEDRFETFVFHKVGTSFAPGDPNLAFGEAPPPAYSYLASSAHASGVVFANLDAGTSIKFVPGLSRVNYSYEAGFALPFRNNVGNLVAPPGGTPQPAQLV